MRFVFLDKEERLKNRSSRPAILAVDDREENLLALNTVLAERDFDITWARSGTDAFKLAAQHEFALILLDVQMPQMDGFQVLKKLRSNNPSIKTPVIFITANSLTRDEEVLAYQSGAADIIYKPVIPEILKSKVQVFIDLFRAREGSVDLKQMFEAKEAHRSAEERVVDLLENMGDAFISLDRDFRVLLVNRHQERISGLSRAQTLGRIHWEIWSKESMPQIWHAYQKVRDEHVSVQFEQFIPELNIWISVDAYPTAESGVAAFFRDITSQKRAAEAIKNLQYRFERSAQATELGVWYCDLPFNVLIWNDEVKKHFFLPPESQVTIDIFYERIHKDDREQTRLAIGKSIANHEPYDTIYRTTNPDNLADTKAIRAIGWTDYNSNGDAIRFDGITLDVSAELQTRADLVSAKHEAEKANQLKSAFLANMSHEIRTPLGAMMGFADLLRDRGLTETERSNYIDILARNGEQLTVIINDILDISKVEAGHLTLEYRDLSPEQIASDVISLMRVKAKEKNLSLELVLGSAVPNHVVSDPTRIRQVLLNLVSNAVKFTQFGSVKIKVFGLKNESGSESVCFEVMDSGIGVSPAQLENIFKVFVQADHSMTRRFGGTGLGLALSRKLARALGGDVTLLESNEHRGSRFLFSLEHRPQNLDRDVSLDKAEVAEEIHLSDHVLDGKNVLVVDDAPDNQKLIWHYLTKFGAIVDSAENGLVGFQKAIAGDHDIVLMDIQMPEMDGYTATQKLRDAGYRKPIIALTAHAMDEVRKKCLYVGCTDHLPKPIVAKDLVRSIIRHTAKESKI